jgi:heme-degrading monooxygenase HmoA
VTIVSRARLAVGAEPAWDAAFRDRAEAARSQPGWVSLQLCIPVEAPDERVVVGTWQSRADWEAWHATEVFERTRAPMDDAEAGEREEWWHEVVIDDRAS